MYLLLKIHYKNITHTLLVKQCNCYSGGIFIFVLLFLNFDISFQCRVVIHIENTDRYNCLVSLDLYQ